MLTAAWGIIGAFVVVGLFVLAGIIIEEVVRNHDAQGPEDEQ